MQEVQVMFTGGGRWYSYQWPVTERPALKVGDRVVVPPNWNNDFPSFATVMQLGRGEGYSGPLATIMEKVEDE